MTTKLIENATVAVVSDSDKPLAHGKLTDGSFIFKDDRHLVVMPRHTRPCRHAPHNPLLYEGRFFTSRQKQNGNISLHGVISGSTNLCEAYIQARLDLDEFFTKLEAIV